MLQVSETSVAYMLGSVIICPAQYFAPDASETLLRLEPLVVSGRTWFSGSFCRYPVTKRRRPELT